MASAANLFGILSVCVGAGLDTFRFPCGPRDCAEATQKEYANLINTLTTDRMGPVCETTDGGGWTLIQVVTITDRL